MTEQVSAKNRPAGISWSEIKDNHKELASHGVFKEEGTKKKGNENKDSEGAGGSFFGTSWTNIQAAFVSSKQFLEHAQICLREGYTL